MHFGQAKHISWAECSVKPVCCAIGDLEELIEISIEKRVIFADADAQIFQDSSSIPSMIKEPFNERI